MSISQANTNPPRARKARRGERSTGTDRQQGRSAVQRAGRLLTALGLGRPSLGFNLTELSESTGIHKATTQRLLSALEETGLVERGSDMRFRIGLRLVELASTYLDDLDLVEQARPMLQRLAADTQETVHLGTPSGRSIAYIDKVESTHSLRMVSRIGGLNPLHCTALGKALLASGDETYLASILDGGLEQRTPNTITGEKALRTELVAIRARGYAVDREETRLGIRCVGAEIRGRGGKVIGAISISGPSVRMGEEKLQELGVMVRRAADKVSARMGYIRVEVHA